jgi:iron complex transport system ATP-binding protein
MLQADNISLSVGDKTILKDISLGVMAGEVLAIAGPNGAGKSSLLKILSGELQPSSGQVNLNRQALKHWSMREQAKTRAILPQHSRLGFPFRVEEVVSMGRTPYRYSHNAKQNNEATQQAMQTAQVHHLEGRLFTTLSGGEQQRVQLARVLAQLWNPGCETPRYLLLDEPTSALDLSHQHHVLGLTQHLATSWNIGVLAVLHDLNLAALYADRIAVLEAGELSLYGNPSDVLSPHAIHEVFQVNVDVISHPRQTSRPLVIAHKPLFDAHTAA